MTADLMFGLLPEHTLLCLILVLMLLDIARGEEQLAGLLFSVSVAGGCLVLATQLWQGYSADMLAAEIHIDRFALLARLVLLGSGLILGLHAGTASNGCKFWILLASSLLGAMVVMESAGFISLFMGIEMLSLPAFALMVTGRGSAADAGEGAFKYLLLSSVASAMILFGLSLAYGATGTLAIATFASMASAGKPGIAAPAALVICGFFIKAAVFPFHGWAPDAYASARMPVTAFLASVIKGAVVLSLVRIFSTLPLDAATVAVVTILSVASIFYGNIAAIRQGRFKRLLAYSSIAHAGYMMFALADSTGSRPETLLYYVAAYGVSTIVACACFHLIGTDGNDALDSLDGAFASHPVTSVLLLLAILSLAGIPPLPGFFAKLFIFRSVIASGHLFAAILAFAGSYAGVVYYLGMVFRMFAPPAPCRSSSQVAPGWGWSGVLLGSTVFLLLILIPGIFHRLIAAM